MSVAREGVVGLVEGTLDVLGVGHGFALLFQLLLFAVRQARTLQLVVLELQEVLLLAVALDVVLQRLQLAVDC